MDKNNYTKKKELAEELRKSVDLHYIINAASKIFCNPVFMFDTSYNLLAHSDKIVTDDPIVCELLSTKTFSHETVNFFNEEKFILSFANSETAVLMKSDKLKYERINGKLFNADNVQVANFLVLACQTPFEEGDMEIVEIMCGILSERLQENKALYDKISKVYQDDLLFDFIHSNEGNLTVADALKSDNFLAVVDIGEYDPTTTHLAYFRDRLSKLQPEYAYYVDLSNVIVLIGINRQILKPQKHLKKLSKFFAQNNLYAGVSSGFQDLSELKRCYGEAINALNYGLTNKRSDDNFFFYDDFRAEHFLNTVKEVHDFADIYCPVVSFIQNYDAENGTSLLNTLYNYLLYGKSRSAAAKTLNMPLAEFSRQMHILKNKFGINFSNGNTLFNIFISIKMLNKD